jgi:hypothetical protein
MMSVVLMKRAPPPHHSPAVKRHGHALTPPHCLHLILPARFPVVCSPCTGISSGRARRWCDGHRCCRRSRVGRTACIVAAALPHFLLNLLPRFLRPCSQTLAPPPPHCRHTHALLTPDTAVLADAGNAQFLAPPLPPPNARLSLADPHALASQL